MPESVIEGALLSAAIAAGLGEPEARATIDSGVKAGRLHPRALQAQRPARRLATWTETPEPAPDDEPGEARPAALLSEGADDDGNSRCVAALYPDRFLHCDALGWLGWDGVKWAAGAESVLDGAIKTTLKTRRLAAVAAEREAIVKAATPSARRVRDARFMLGSLLHAPVDSFDGPAHLLNCQNGVVNLATGELVTHDPQAHRFTHATNAEYNPQADRGPGWPSCGKPSAMISICCASCKWRLGTLSQPKRVRNVFLHPRADAIRQGYVCRNPACFDRFTFGARGRFCHIQRTKERYAGVCPGCIAAGAPGVCV
ncbi:MAG: hypothetical protein IPH87_28660 [Anaerolineae bacterium]|nr:hypothetical protein [Anaerolineae bacterium]